ncbi:hypothetical protein EXS65_02120 [Candidatus Peribacteria bacterium]|nr:hypothetical protein [Candidatus Peribacteria bacterium]
MIHSPASVTHTTIDELPMHEVSLNPSLLREESDRHRIVFTDTVFSVQEEVKSVLAAKKSSERTVLPEPAWVDELMDFGSFDPRAAMKASLGEHRYKRLKPNLGALDRLLPKAGTVNHS